MSIGTKCVGDHLLIGTKCFGDCLFKGTNSVGYFTTVLLGTKCPGEPNELDPFVFWDQMSGDQKHSGPNVPQPSEPMHIHYPYHTNIDE